MSAHKKKRGPAAIRGKALSMTAGKGPRGRNLLSCEKKKSTGQWVEKADCECVNQEVQRLLDSASKAKKKTAYGLTEREGKKVATAFGKAQSSWKQKTTFPFPGKKRSENPMENPAAYRGKSALVSGETSGSCSLTGGKRGTCSV